jgi:hypothetical protein
MIITKHFNQFQPKELAVVQVSKLAGPPIDQILCRLDNHISIEENLRVGMVGCQRGKLTTSMMISELSLLQ